MKLESIKFRDVARMSLTEIPCVVSISNTHDMQETHTFVMGVESKSENPSGPQAVLTCHCRSVILAIMQCNWAK